MNVRFKRSSSVDVTSSELCLALPLNSLTYLSLVYFSRGCCNLLSSPPFYTLNTLKLQVFVVERGMINIKEKF